MSDPSSAFKSAIKRIWDLYELRHATIEPPRALIEGLIFAGETCLLVGRPKVGKSRLTLQLCLSLIRGEPFLGAQVRRKCRVLLLDLENRISAIQERARKMSDENIDDCDLFLYSPASLDDNQIRLAQHGIKILQRVVEAFEPDVLVIDTWRLIVGDLDENKAETVVNALRSLSTVRQTRPDLVIFLVHHLRKQSPKGGPSLRTDPYTWVESVSGHHALVAHVDCCYGLEREIEDGEEVIVFGGVARNADSHALLLEDDPETLRFEPRTGESSLLVVLTPKEKEFWAIAKQLGRFTFTDLLLSAQTKNKKALSAMLTKAGNHGLVRANGKVYEICEDALDT